MHIRERTLEIIILIVFIIFILFAYDSVDRLGEPVDLPEEFDADPYLLMDSELSDE